MGWGAFNIFPTPLALITANTETIFADAKPLTIYQPHITRTVNKISLNDNAGGKLLIIIHGIGI